MGTAVPTTPPEVFDSRGWCHLLETTQQACTAPRAPLPAQGQRNERSENIRGDLNATRLILSHVHEEAEVKRSSLCQFTK